MVLQLANLVAVPLWAGQVVSGASISATSILGNLLLLVLIPLALGLVVRARYAEHAATWQVELGKVSNLALAIALIAGSRSTGPRLSRCSDRGCWWPPRSPPS